MATGTEPYSIDPATKLIADALLTMKDVEVACYEANRYGEGVALSGIIYLLAHHVDNNTHPDSSEFAVAQAVLRGYAE